MKIKKEYVLREVANEFIVVPTGKEAVHFNGIISLNKSGAKLFKYLTENRSKEDLLDLFLNTYDVSKEQALLDIESFIKKLESKHILEEN